MTMTNDVDDAMATIRTFLDAGWGVNVAFLPRFDPPLRVTISPANRERVTSLGKTWTEAVTAVRQAVLSVHGTLPEPADREELT